MKIEGTITQALALYIANHASTSSRCTKIYNLLNNCWIGRSIEDLKQDVQNCEYDSRAGEVLGTPNFGRKSFEDLYNILGITIHHKVKNNTP